MQEWLGAGTPLQSNLELVVTLMKTLVLIVAFCDTLSMLAKLGHFRRDWKTGNASDCSQGICLVVIWVFGLCQSSERSLSFPGRDPPASERTCCCLTSWGLRQTAKPAPTPLGRATPSSH